MIQIETLWKGKYASVISPKKKELNYECLHEPNIIGTLPILEYNNKKYVIIRKEFCPPYMIKDVDGETEPLYYTIITGKIEKDEPILNAFEREMEEETGVKIKDYDIIHQLDEIPVCKSTDMRMSLFIIEIKSYDLNKATGDGTLNEELSKSVLFPIEDIDKLYEKRRIDFLLYSSLSIYEKTIQESL